MKYDMTKTTEIVITKSIRHKEFQAIKNNRMEFNSFH